MKDKLIKWKKGLIILLTAASILLIILGLFIYWNWNTNNTRKKSPIVTGKASGSINEKVKIDTINIEILDMPFDEQTSNIKLRFTNESNFTKYINLVLLSFKNENGEELFKVPYIIEDELKAGESMEWGVSVTADVTDISKVEYVAS